MNKKLTALLSLLPLLTLLILTSCESAGIPSAETQKNYINTPMYCQIDETIYERHGAKIRRCSNSFPEGNSLCLDPLCRHYDSICAEKLDSMDFVTDGEKLYIHSNSYYKSSGGSIMTNSPKDDNKLIRLDAVYRLDPSTGEIKMLVEFAAANGLNTCISTDGEYIYYVEAYLKDENLGENSGTYGIPKRVPCKGGKPEEFLEGDYSAYAVVYADRENYYVTDEGMFTQVNRKTGEKINIPQPGVYAHHIVFHNGVVYLDGVKDETNHITNMCLWKWENGTFTEAVSDIASSNLGWDEGGVWYQKLLPEDEFVMLGSKEVYDGRGMSMHDFVRTFDGMLYYHDFATGEETAYSLGNENLGVSPIGVSNGYIIASCIDLSKLEYKYETKNLKPEPDGTVSFHGAITAEE